MPRVMLRVRRIVDDRIVDPTTKSVIPKDYPIDVVFHGEIMQAIARGELERIVRDDSAEGGQVAAPPEPAPAPAPAYAPPPQLDVKKKRQHPPTE